MTLKGLKNGSVYKTQDEADDASEDTASTNTEVESVQSSLCCLQGCLAASAVGFAFFVGLPTGILLVFYASNNNDVTLLSVGGVLIALPVITLLLLITICLNRRRLKNLRKKKPTHSAGNVDVNDDSVTDSTKF